MNASSLILFSLTSFAVLVWGLAFWRGGPAERWGAAIFAGAQLTFLVVAFVLGGGAQPYIGLILQLTLDGLSAVALLFVLLRYSHPWLGVAILLCAAQFTLQSVYLVGELKKDYWHILLNNLNFVAIHISLLVGTIQHWVRRARISKSAAAAAP
jgi:hypothetical protein